MIFTTVFEREKFESKIFLLILSKYQFHPKYNFLYMQYAMIKQMLILRSKILMGRDKRISGEF
jgi:hypothetical protein